MGEPTKGRLLPWYYLPGLMVLQFTEPLWVLFGVGIAALLLARVQRPPTVVFLVLALWLLLPTLPLILRKAWFYDNFRQFPFVTPVLFVIAAFGLEWVFRRVQQTPARLAIVAAAILPGAIAIYRLHPYQYVYYNSLAGRDGGGGARLRAGLLGDVLCRSDAATQPEPASRLDGRLLGDQRDGPSLCAGRSDRQILQPPRRSDHRFVRCRRHFHPRQCRSRHPPRRSFAGGDHGGRRAAGGDPARAKTVGRSLPGGSTPCLHTKCPWKAAGPSIREGQEEGPPGRRSFEAADMAALQGLDSVRQALLVWVHSQGRVAQSCQKHPDDSRSCQLPSRRRPKSGVDADKGLRPRQTLLTEALRVC